MNKIFIIIVTYNGMLWLKKCLDSCKNYPVIVVDNNSTDNTISFIEDNYPEVKLIKQSKNLGFGQANNIGINYALKEGAEYVFLLNQDAYIQPNSIKNLINKSNSNPEYGMISPIHLNGKGDKLDRNFAYYLAYDKNDKFYFDAINNSLKDIYEVPFVNAAAWLIPRSTLDIVGGFDPLFFHYGEDENYCQRVIFHKLKIGVISGSFVMHDREDRQIKRNSFEADLRKKEIMYKIKWADINKDLESKITSQRKKIRSQLFNSILKFKFKRARALKAELILIKKMYSKILISRKINSEKGSHYLY